ncbi:MAG: radical SAM protein [Candidatus Paceibacterota bacterium]
MVCWLTINRACNMRCNWCYAKNDNFNLVKTMTYTVFENILTAISSTPIKKFILIGGEPTLHHQLPLMIKRLKPAKVLLVTNAVKLADIKYLKLLKDNGLDMVTVSLKGTTEEQYKQNTGVACLKSVEKAIANLNDLNINYSISVTFSSSIMNTLPMVLDWMKSSNAKVMSINYCRPVVLNNKVSVKEVPHPKEMARKTVESYEMIESSGVKCVYNFLLPLCLLPIEFINKLVSKDLLTTVCQLQKNNGLIFMPDGNLVPCNHLFEYSLGKLGEDFNTSTEFESFRNKDEIKDFYRKTQNLPDIKCKECILQKHCGGGCFIQYLQYDSSEIIIKPFT